MNQMTPGQARIVDPVLSTHALGYRQAGLVARTLFPLADVAMYGGKVTEFDKSAFKLYNSKRAPGTNTKRIQFGYQGKPYAIVPSALEAPVPRELMRDATQVPGINLASRAVNTVLRALNLEHEYEAAQLARNASNYDAGHKVALTGTSRWSGSAGDPSGDIRDGKEAVRQTIGVYPNTAILSASAFSAAQENAKILDRTKYTSKDSITTDILARLWGLAKVEVGEAVVADAAESFGDVWGDDVILAYTNVSTDPNVEEPSFAYTYVIEGHPLVEQPYWDNSAKSWIYGVSFDNTPVLSGITAGFLIQGAGASPA
jgi:hypothetical protein